MYKAIKIEKKQSLKTPKLKKNTPNVDYMIKNYLFQKNS